MKKEYEKTLVELVEVEVDEEEVVSGERWERDNLRKREATWIRNKSDSSGGGDELLCQDAWNVRVRFVVGSDVQNRQASDHDELDRPSEEGR